MQIAGGVFNIKYEYMAVSLQRQAYSFNFKADAQIWSDVKHTSVN